MVGGGLDSISLVQNEHMNLHRMVDEELMAIEPNIFMPMLQTAEVVAERYSIAARPWTSTVCSHSSAPPRPMRPASTPTSWSP